MKAQEKEILIDQIMGLLSSATGTEGGQHDSLRYTVDYDPKHFRYTQQDQIEDIKFEFLDEDQGHQENSKQNYKNTRAVPQQTSKLKMEQHKQIAKNNESEKKRQLSRQRIRQKNTLKLGELIKKKISEKEQADQFTKKYDNLFDEVFNQSKLKTHKKENQKKQTSTTLNTVANPTTSNVVMESKPSNSHQSIRHQQHGQHKPKAPEEKVVSQSKNVSYDKNQPIHIMISEAPSLINIQTHQPIKHQEDSSSFLSMASKNSLLQTEQLQSKMKIKFTDSVLQQPTSKLQKSTVQSEVLKEKTKKIEEDLPLDKISSTSRERKQSQQLGESKSLKSLDDSTSSIPELITRDNFEAILQQFSHKPHLIEALKPPIKVTYQDKKKVVVIKPTHLLAPPNKPIVSSPSKPTVKFCYGKSQQPASVHNQSNPTTKVKNFVEFNIKQEVRLPKFLRKLRELTNSYPNFYSNKTFTKQNVKILNQQLFEAFQETKKAIKTLKIVHLRYHQIIKLTKELYQRISKNVNEGSKEDKCLLQFFAKYEWSNFASYLDIDSIKPCDLFQKRILNELQFMTLLNSYEELIYSIEEEEVLIIGEPQSVKKYMEFRDKLWAIEKNLRIMSQDFYLKAIIRIHIPQHIADTGRILKQGKPLSDHDRKSQLERLLFLQERRDAFSCSCLGSHVIKILLEEDH